MKSSARLHRSIHRNALIKRGPQWWKKPCSNIECTLHQLAPYIGKIKSSIAGDLVERYSKPGELVVDPFAGAGTIPLEAIVRGRRVFAADHNPYAEILCRAKLFPPQSLTMALKQAELAILESRSVPAPDLRSVPPWVRAFFHPETLRDALRFSTIARRSGNEFLMACFLGVLHHQRPGFLSYPSSHLVPYLRSRKYPRSQFPEMYAYRELKPRLFSKITRTYRRYQAFPRGKAVVHHTDIANLTFPRQIDAVITSPPYMNALDYIRDNRLRLWFIAPSPKKSVYADYTKKRQAFVDAITTLAAKIKNTLSVGGHCILVVGEGVQRDFRAHPAKVVVDIFDQVAPMLNLKDILTDSIPDIRRSRHELSGVKTEHFLVFKRA